VINFRYHIVSLMAVFMALSIGIVLGVSFGEPVNAGLATQADADRKQVQELRAELDRRRALDEYRDAWSATVGSRVADGVLAGQRVGMVAMPNAPASVMDAVGTAVAEAGGTVTSITQINDNSFDPSTAEELAEAVQPFSGALGLTEDMSQGTRLGVSLGRALSGREPGDADPLAEQMRQALTETSLVDIETEGEGQAQLLVVVAASENQMLSADALQAHIDADVGLRSRALGLVLAGPNSAGLDGSEVLAVRSTAAAADVLSTVDVADLASGVTTVVLAGKEQLLGRHGHYGAHAKSDSPLPELPVR
jgi:hypothetical protein